jgi:ABC-2 type transport system ATP-binding protein
MEQVEEICDHIILMNKGQKILDGTVDNVKQDFKENLFSIGFENKPDLHDTPIFEVVTDKEQAFILKIKEGYRQNDVLRYFLDRNADIISFNELLPSLSDIFIKLVEGTSITRQFQETTA